MQQRSDRRRVIVRVAAMAILAGMVGACADQTGTPAPVYMMGGPTMGAAAPASAPVRHEARQITVQHGQTLNAIARDHHVKAAAIIAANQLKPPYELKAGSRLIIPDSGSPPAQVAAVPAPGLQRVAAVPLPPPAASAASAQRPPALTPPPSAATVPDIVPLDGPPPKEMAAAPAQSQPTVQSAPPTSTAAASGSPPSVLPPRNPAAALPLPGEASVAEPVAAGSGRFAWPVQGRILANYGAATNGGRNDGINIAAPRGTPVRSIDAGTIAYVGNEVKGYGNLVLVKHDNGWISAYAHLDDPAVKVGDKVASGQAIAKVGETGGVSQPQLHFELRRGKKPVDPREFLAPTPSAGSAAGRPAG
jgi:murein DD-endopeptidase MepM/ murein hydrolase activator NlpD